MKTHVRLFVLLVLLLGLGSYLTAQEYLPAESFEDVWSGTPAAPSGWTQVQVQAGTGSYGSDISWERSVYSGSWSPAGSGTKPTSVPNGTAVAHYNDYYAKAGQIDRLYYSTAIDLSSSSYPRVSFWYFYYSGSATLAVVGSNDGGTTWNQLGSNVLATGSVWTKINVNIPPAYKVNNFMVGFQVTAAYGSHDLWLDSFNIEEGPAPLSGTYTIDPGGSGPANYATFTAAINALNSLGVGSGGATFNVKDGVAFIEECPVITATGTSDNQIVFQRDNSTGTRPVIKPTTSTAGISILGGDWFTFNGIDVMINNGSSVLYGYYLRAASVTDGAQHNTIRNSLVTLNKANSSTRGVYQYYNYTPTSAIGANSYNLYDNIDVENSLSGIYLNGSSSTTYYDQFNEVKNCTIGADSADNMGGLATGYGIYGSYQNSYKVHDNEVRNFTTTTYYNNYGIYVSSGYSCDIYSNKIHDIKCTYNSVSYNVTGIYVSLSSSLGNTARVYNNMIWNLTHTYSGSASPTHVVYGIWLAGSTSSNTYHVDFNSVRVSGPLTANSAGVFFNTNTAVNNFRNNVVANLTGAQASSKHVCVYYSSATIGSGTSEANNNVLYIESGGNGYVVRTAISDYSTLALWNAASGQDASSKSSNPQFSNVPLYVSTTTPTPVESNGAFGSITWVQYDIDGNRVLRNDPPDIGADEGDFLPEVECETPTGQPTDLILVPGTNTIAGAFTASDAEAYLVIRHSDPDHDTPPTDGTLYSAGTTLGNGTVISVGSGTTFITAGLTAETPYHFTIYAFNANGINAPKYLPDGPLTGSMTTLPVAPDNPASFIATASSLDQIDLAATPNDNNDNIMVAWNSTNTFGIPLVTGYMEGDPIIGGGTVLYMGPAANLPDHTGLNEYTTYHYKVWSYVAVDRATFYLYSGGLTASATTLLVNGQIVIYTAANIPTTYNTTPAVTSRALEPGVLNITIPSGKVISSVDVEYSMTAQGGGWMGEQRSFLLCSTNNTTEAQVYSGSGSSSGTYSYSRTGLTIATGLPGSVSFELHAFRTYGGSGSNTTFNYVNNNTWKLVIYYMDAPDVLAPSALTATPDIQYADLDWSENNTPPATIWDLIYGAPGFDPAVAGTLVLDIDNKPFRLNGLDPNTTYEWYVRSNTGTKALSDWAGPASFTTLQMPEILPWSEDFETWPNGWTILNAAQTNQWYVGSATSHAGNQSAYISNDGGNTNAYSTITTSVAHMYRDIYFTADSRQFNLSFWWKGYGESATYDYLQVFLVEDDVFPLAGTRLTAGQIGTNYNLQTSWNQASIVIPGNHSDSSKRLVFSWWNDASGGANPPIAIDDIFLEAVPNPTEPEFMLSPTQKIWDIQLINTSTPAQEFIIKNNGGGDLSIVSPIEIVDDDADHFILTDPNLYPYALLGPLETMSVFVQFHPTSIGQKNARLRIVDDLATKGLVFTQKSVNAPKAERFAILQGTGYDPSVQIPWDEDFTGLATGSLPVDWTRTHTNWSVNASSTAGGSSPEMRFNWQPSATSTFRVITPPINAGAKGSYVLSFKHYIDYYSTPAAYKVQMSQDLANWTDVWSLVSPGANVGPETIQIPLTQTGMFYLAWVYEGSSSNTDYWYIDDITLGLPDITVPGPESVVGGDIPPELLGPDTGIPAVIYTVTASGVRDVVVNNPGWGVDWYCWIRVGAVLYAAANPIPAATPSWTFSAIDFDAKGDAVVILNDNQTLPVELSSFTATLTADLFVKIAWVAQSETNHLGYNLLRGDANNAAQAIQINSQIITNEDGTAAGTQISYNFIDAEVNTGTTYYYWLESIDLGGLSVLHGPVSVLVNGQPEDPGTPELPTVTKLLNAYPNPFNPSTNIRFQIKEAAPVKIEIYNIKGQLIRVYEDGHMNPGYHQISWDGRDANGRPAASGVYLYRMTSGKYSSSKRMVLAK